MKRRVYVAGPDVFMPEPDKSRWNGLRTFEALQCGFELLIPEDNIRSPREIFERNILMMKGADACIANLEPFRSPSADPGTAFELGFFYAYQKPVAAYGLSITSYATRVKSDDGYEVENFGLPDNVMLVKPLDYQTWDRGVHGFRRCLEHLKRNL